MAGQPIAISRSTWAAVEHLVAGANAGSSTGTNGRGGATDAMILVKNETGGELKPGSIIGLDGLNNTPSSNPKDWAVYRFHKAVKPDPDKYPFALAIEEIASGKPGYALISGVHKVKVDVKNKDHAFARPVKDDTEKLESCSFDPARLLYRDKESGVTDGLVHFPLGESWDWGMVLVATSQKLPSYTVLGVTGAANPPSGSGRDDNAEFLSRVVVKGETPSKNPDDFVVTLADAPGGSDALVPALYAGICPVLVNVEKKEHTHAKAEESGALKSGFSGFARIVFPPKSSRSTGTQWCYVSIPESPPLVFPVALEKTGGEAGDHEKQCSFKYKAYPFPKSGGADALAEGLDLNDDESPYKRWEFGKMKEATFGLALYGESNGGDPKLLVAWCNEVPEIATCEE